MEARHVRLIRLDTKIRLIMKKNLGAAKRSTNDG